MLILYSFIFYIQKFDKRRKNKNDSKHALKIFNSFHLEFTFESKKHIACSRPHRLNSVFRILSNEPGMNSQTVCKSGASGKAIGELDFQIPSSIMQ